MKKNTIIVTGGAGFVGSNLIDHLIRKTKFKIISIDDYSSGKKKNHIYSKRERYISSDTKKISKILDKYKKKINCIIIEPIQGCLPINAKTPAEIACSIISFSLIE